MLRQTHGVALARGTGQVAMMFVYISHLSIYLDQALQSLRWMMTNSYTTFQTPDLRASHIKKTNGRTPGIEFSSLVWYTTYTTTPPRSQSPGMDRVQVLDIKSWQKILSKASLLVSKLGGGFSPAVASSWAG
jgi:hypothetical protein